MNEARDRPGAVEALMYQAYRLGRRLVRLPFVAAWIPGKLRSRVQSRMLARVIDQLPDRRYMEAVILPRVASLKPSRLLDVGVEDYTQHYSQRFSPDCDYWTLDLNPNVARYRPPDRHIVANVLDVASYFEPGSLDVVLMNGPFGYGIDRHAEQERTIEAVRSLLRPGGRLLVGWDRDREGRPVVMEKPGPDADARIKDPTELEAIRSHFRHEPPPGLPARMDFADCSHVYDWFRLA